MLHHKSNNIKVQLDDAKENNDIIVSHYIWKIKNQKIQTKEWGMCLILHIYNYDIYKLKQTLS